MKNSNYIIKILIWLEILAVFHVYSCDAPRNNPLDPNNPDLLLSVIKGNVTTSFSPFTGIPDVIVFWEPGNKLVKTDANGNFLIEDIRSVDGRLIFQKEGFRSDTIYVSWNGGKLISKQLHLVSLPALEYLKITTSVEYEVSQKSSKVGFTAKIESKGNQIDSAYIANQLLSLKRKMTLLEGEYSLVLNQDDLGSYNLENLVGEDFDLFISDSALGSAYKIGSGRMTRVIDTEPQAVSPNNSDTISFVPPVVQWNPAPLGFSFNYLIEIYTNEALNNRLVYSSGPLESGTTFLDTQYSLPAGEYFWVIWIADQFSNRARSKPAIFVVNQ